MKPETVDIAIVGAGASGLAAAVAAKRANKEASVVLLERLAAPGSKLSVTGNGRCNFLNEGACPSKYYSSGASLPLLNSVFFKYPVAKLKEFFSEIGIEPAAEDGGRLYPRSFSAKDVTKALANEAASLGARFVLKFPVKSCEKRGAVFEITSETGEKILSKKLILSCGGKAGGKFGCFGDGYRVAKNFGHGIIKPIPALVKIKVLEDTSGAWGVRARARVGLYEKQPEDFVKPAGGPETPMKLLSKDSGELQFTNDNALSGICVFNLSRFLRKKEGFSYFVKVDLFEEYSEEDLAFLLKKRFEKFGSLKATLAGLLPEKLIDYILASGKFISVKDSSLLKNLTFTAIGTGSLGEAQLTAGGVDLLSVNPKDLSSLITRGLFFSGELLDIDAPCGGYNLSFAFASGLVAGTSAAQSLSAELIS